MVYPDGSNEETTSTKGSVVLNGERRPRTTKTRLWQWFFEINRIKALIHFSKCTIAKNKHENEWVEYLLEAWKTMGWIGKLGICFIWQLFHLASTSMLGKLLWA